ncbi:MAG: histidine kinase, partial [Chloroflexi bacterium]|nr:histidine kinase [Chloroflexota bacterium]
LEATRALARPRAPEEYRRAINVMQQENDHMTRLINDLLALARADIDHNTMHRGNVDLSEIVLDVAERLESLAQLSCMTIRIDPLPELLVPGDQTSVTQMVTNIVENSLKYGAGFATHVRISGGYRHNGDIAGVWLRVSDDGPGIAEEHLPHLCERFYRVDTARTHRDGGALGDGSAEIEPAGSGLGLAIVRAIVRSHQGDISIQSQLGMGTVCEVWLPKGKGAASPNHW